MGDASAPVAERRIAPGLARSNSTARDYSNEQYVNDVTIEWLYTPHSMIALGTCVVALVITAFMTDQNVDIVTSVANAVLLNSVC